MTKAVLACAFFVMSGSLGAQVDATAPEVRVATFPWLSHVAGSCWRSELSKGQVDRQCFQTQFDRVVRVEQKIVQTDGAKESTLDANSLYAWDPRKKKVRHVFWASDGAFETATGWAEGDALMFYLDRESGPDGKAPGRTVLRRTDADEYRASREKLEDDHWREQFSFTYKRDGSAVGSPDAQVEAIRRSDRRSSADDGG